ncbi:MULTISPECIES: hypothetical protein [Marivita]|uniref:Uncharacterized protein n=1 Tax=Marivita cryptomonadis TaxID=505252 RepID=A0A9Q2NZ97_9RHOB|nr:MULTISPECIES: hypothetical protein [Marivita]MCR9169279.1 hypothetical protein [Paracoccaceae bacterium]MBM2323988.1 hypothetical protein [Marivita cryptomonadis]MBM2333577.1 hypothetical protein [Marivita cryptomonadis]MBM2343155.1 hypothetical protein [Marivita cryptomonadis]MBM2347826.1 hypothetical protein [Marivita cryptomonadis]
MSLVISLIPALSGALHRSDEKSGMLTHPQTVIYTTTDEAAAPSRPAIGLGVRLRQVS